MLVFGFMKAGVKSSFQIFIQMKPSESLYHISALKKHNFLVLFVD